MSLVRPFCGLRFTEKAGEMRCLMAPPYDVISDDYRRELYGRSPYNIVRISKSAEIAKEEPADHYKAAAKTWTEWREQGIVAKDTAPSFYFYEQEFHVHGRTFNRLGLVCAHKLVEFGQGVLPHEKTLSGPKEDRYRLLKQTRTHFGQIFGLYHDDDGAIDAVLRAHYAASERLCEARDDDGVVHRLSKTSNPERVKEIAGLFNKKDMIIADGHHRYETALRYSKEAGTREASCLMMTVVSLANPGLLILPTHRLIKNLPSFEVEKLLAALASKFEIRRLKCGRMDKDEKKRELLAAMRKLAEIGKSALGLYSGNHEFVLLTKKDGIAPDVEGSDVYKSLDVVTLHKLILEDELRIDQEKLANETHVEYIKDSGHAIDQSIAKVDEKTHQAVFFMNAPSVRQTAAVAENGEKMPQKSTFFHPKVFTGLVTYPIEPGVVEA